MHLRSRDCRNTDVSEGAVTRRGLPPERVQAVLDHLAAGLNPMQAARAAGVSKSFVYVWTWR